MTKVLIITEQELQGSITLDEESLRAVEGAFIALADGRVNMPPILRLDIPEHNGEIDVKTAFISGLDYFAVKMSPGFFDNPSFGLPSTSGLMVLFSATTGIVQAVLLDNGYLTNIRTALAGAIAAKYLARTSVETVGVIGVGAQARFQMEALKLTRSFSRILIWGRDNERAIICARDLADSLGVKTEICNNPRDVVTQSMIVVTSTSATEPLIKDDWLHDGLHITAMGSDAEHKNELAPQIVSMCDHFVCDTRVQSARLGELHHAIKSGVVPIDTDVTELGQVISGKISGRNRDEDITVCDLTGTGAQDTAIACLSYQKTMMTSFGTFLDS